MRNEVCEGGTSEAKGGGWCDWWGYWDNELGRLRLERERTRGSTLRSEDEGAKRGVCWD